MISEFIVLMPRAVPAVAGIETLCSRRVGATAAVAPIPQKLRRETVPAGGLTLPFGDRYVLYDDDADAFGSYEVPIGDE